ncbi:MAG: ABC transporter substrate-binding protein [Burkholderiales bacterium]|nr:ABC transporter substrate-binding protein [Burkholderiales bacterium]
MEELVRVNKDGKPELALAESYKWIDPKTVEFKLRKNVVFQDGEKLNAQVFRKSFDEVQRWDNPHPPGAFLNFAKGTKLDVIDDHTVRFTFPETDSAAMMKFRGMHVGSSKFWKELGFVDKKTGKAEGHW